jgi:hypothetical protein
MCSEECAVLKPPCGVDVRKRSTSKGPRLAVFNASNAILRFAVPEVHAWKRREAVLSSGEWWDLKHGVSFKV